MKDVIIFATHPDDEVVGCTSIILRKKNIAIVYIVVEQEIRKIEAENMALFVGLNKKNLLFLNYKPEDLLKKEKVKEIKEKIKKIITKYKPKVIYIPSYEGGHFCHDLTNYAVSKAAEETGKKIQMYEFPLYNNYPKHVIQKILRRLSLYLPLPHNFPRRFIPIDGFREVNANMSDKEMMLKKQMLRIYKSQNKNDILVKMFWYNEKYRVKPEYDYRKRPHFGYLNYEMVTKLKFSDFLKVIK